MSSGLQFSDIMRKIATFSLSPSLCLLSNLLDPDFAILNLFANADSMMGDPSCNQDAHRLDLHFSNWQIPKFIALKCARSFGIYHVDSKGKHPLNCIYRMLSIG